MVSVVYLGGTPPVTGAAVVEVLALGLDTQQELDALVANLEGSGELAPVVLHTTLLDFTRPELAAWAEGVAPGTGAERVLREEYTLLDEADVVLFLFHGTHPAPQLLMQLALALSNDTPCVVVVEPGCRFHAPLIMHLGLFSPGYEACSSLAEGATGLAQWIKESGA